MENTEEEIFRQFKESAKLKVEFGKKYSSLVEKVAREIIRAYQNGGKTVFCGNGGSAADAQHLAAEFVGKYRKERKALPSLALTANTSGLTAIGNDYGFEKVFERQIEAWVSPKDVVVGISTSGNSLNVLRAVTAAKKIGAKTVGFLGNDGGQIGQAVDLPLIVPSKETPRIQEVHIVIGHIICDLVEKELFP